MARTNPSRSVGADEYDIPGRIGAVTIEILHDASTRICTMKDGSRKFGNKMLE